MKSSIKINGYYPILVTVLITLLLLVIFTLRGIFSAIITMQDLDEVTIGQLHLVDHQKLEKASDYVFNTKPVPLDLKE